MDFDPQGNLYAAYRGGSGKQGTSIEKFAPRSGSGTILGMQLNQPQGLIVDDKGDIVVVNEKSPGDNYLDVFAPGRKRPNLRFRQPKGGYPIQIAITEDEGSLFTTTFNNGRVYEIPYPFSKGLTWTLLQDDPYGLQQGIALSNGQVF
jgi:DNA-binding beta-propeller fold protein YncE